VTEQLYISSAKSLHH